MLVFFIFHQRRLENNVVGHNLITRITIRIVKIAIGPLSATLPAARPRIWFVGEETLMYNFV